MVNPDQTILNLRPARHQLDPRIPYHFLHETEAGFAGETETVNTIFLTGKECVFKCLMCDLWMNTLDEAAPEGAIAGQIDYALAQLPEANAIKLYNNGNFFDTKAIAESEYEAIASRLRNFNRVIVENHPKLYGPLVLKFRNHLQTQLEIAMGLETIHPDVLPKLNKKMTPQDFEKAAAFLHYNEIDTRAFVLLNPPYLTDPEESISWTLKTVMFAFDCGVRRCSIIPVRGGNGMMEELAKEKNYVPPTLHMLEEAFDQALMLKEGLVTADTWDIGFLADCNICFDQRKERLNSMNLSQRIEPRIPCTCSSHHA